MSYNSSGVRQQATTWNLEAPTSTVGLGWRLDVPKIIVDHKQTGVRHDDTFYWIEGGISNKLIQSKKENGLRYYKSENYQFGQIVYLEAEERWTITKEDGTKYVYGGKDSDRETVQYLVKWGNWMGDSRRAAGQSRQAMQWDLSAVKNQWGDSLTFAYQQARQTTGEGGLEHTEASYLTKITNPQGQSIELLYGDKHNDQKKGKVEYQEPHIEQVEPDAFQERYEREYLKTIRVMDNSNNLSYQLNLSYTGFGAGHLYKRLLTGVQKVINSNELPPLEFAYHLSGEKAGLMQVVTTSQGPQVSYTHTAVTIDGSERDLTIQAPSGYAEPHTWIGPDYVVVAWREYNGTHVSETRDVKLFVYQWAGRWIEQFRQTINAGYFANQYTNFQVITRPNFFAVQSGTGLLLSHKDTSQPGRWKMQNETVQEGVVTSTLMAGDNFVAVGNKHGSKLEAFTYNGDQWQLTTLHDNPGDYFYTSGGNYVITHNNDPDPDVITFHFLDEMQQWKKGVVPDAIQPNPDDDENNDDNRSFWHGGPSYAVVMIDEFAEMIFSWDENYRLRREDNVIGERYDQAPVYITSSMFGIVNVNQILGFRYDGFSWFDTLQTAATDKAVSFGNDSFLNAFNIDSAHFNWFDANNDSWQIIPLKSEVLNNGFTVGNDYAFFKDRFLYRSPSGWNKLAYELLVSDYPVGTFIHRHYGGRQLAVFGSNKDGSVRVFHIRNGELTTEDVHLLTGRSVDNLYAFAKTFTLVDNNTLVTFPDDKPVEEAQELTLHKLVDQKLTGKQTVYPVTLVKVDDGFINQPTSYHYTDTSAAVTANGASAQFNEVRVTPGSINSNVAPYGFTIHYFYNGLPSGELSLSVPAGGNAIGYTGRLAGVPYAVKTYNSDNELVRESESGWKVYGVPIERTADQATIARGYFARVVRSAQTQDAVTDVIHTSFDAAAHGQAKTVSTTDSRGRSIATTYQYATDFGEGDDTYGSNLLRQHGTVSPILEQTVSVDGVLMGRSETHYALQHGQPVPAKSVTFPRGDDKSITSLMNYDAYGNLVQSQVEGGVISSFLYGYDYTFPVVEAVGATYNQLVGQVSLSGIQNKDGSALRDDLNSVRTGLSGSLITTRTYDWLYGPTSQTDPRGRTTYTHYDEQGRLHYVKDDDGYVRQKLEYSPLE